MVGSRSHATTASGIACLNMGKWEDRHLGKFWMVHDSVISCCHLVSTHVLVQIATLRYKASAHRT
jgi:hypothetical protein